MKSIFFPESTRGKSDYGWLKTSYSFSFSNYWDDNRVHFGALRVLNDDFIDAGQGFGMHPHENMEIITIPLTGALQHQDSTGGKGIISAGEVQIMSAGSGLQHSEMNASKTEAVTLFQIWIFPKEKNIKPRYDQKMFDVVDRESKLQTVVSPKENSDSLWINQNSWISLIQLKPNENYTYNLNDSSNGVYIMLIDGSASIETQQLERRDAVGIFETEHVHVNPISDCYIIFIEVPMVFSA